MSFSTHAHGEFLNTRTHKQTRNLEASSRASRSRINSPIRASAPTSDSVCVDLVPGSQHASPKTRKLKLMSLDEGFALLLSESDSIGVSPAHKRTPASSSAGTLHIAGNSSHFDSLDTSQVGGDYNTASNELDVPPPSVR